VLSAIDTSLDRTDVSGLKADGCFWPGCVVLALFKFSIQDEGGGPERGSLAAAWRDLDAEHSGAGPEIDDYEKVPKYFVADSKNGGHARYPTGVRACHAWRRAQSVVNA